MSNHPLRASGSGFSLQPTVAWIAILGFSLLTVVGIVAGMGNLLRLLFPIGAFAVGILLYFRYPILYVGFTWWLWFLTPLVRRLVDYRSGWVNPNLILLAPYLVTFVSIITLWKYLPRAHRIGALPFVLVFIGILYGFLIGLVNSSAPIAIRSLLDWLVPVLFGFHLFMNWREYPAYRQNMQVVFLWGVLIMGIYGVFQYVTAPEWERFWLIESEMYTSSGNPEPFGMRVWSTMHSIGPFSCAMMTGLILLFSSRSPLLVPAVGVGYLSFLLTLGRTMWGCWLAALLLLFGSLKSAFQIRLIFTLLLLSVLVIPLVSVEPFAGAIGNRLSTFSTLESDNSANARAGIYADHLNKALTSFIGNGIGNTFILDKDGQLVELVVDSGILDSLFTLGWIGTIPYFGGVLLLLTNMLQSSEARRDPFMSATRSISLSLMLSLVIGSTMLEVSGMFFWGFIGITMAARNYHLQSSVQDERQYI